MGFYNCVLMGPTPDGLGEAGRQQTTRSASSCFRSDAAMTFKCVGGTCAVIAQGIAPVLPNIYYLYQKSLNTCQINPGMSFSQNKKNQRQKSSRI